MNFPQWIISVMISSLGLIISVILKLVPLLLKGSSAFKNNGVKRKKMKSKNSRYAKNENKPSAKLTENSNDITNDGVDHTVEVEIKE